MIGKPSETEFIVFGSLDAYDKWREVWGENKMIIDVKFSLGPQTFDFQHSFGILVIYKEAKEGRTPCECVD